MKKIIILLMLFGLVFGQYKSFTANTITARTTLKIGSANVRTELDTYQDSIAWAAGRLETLKDSVHLLETNKYESGDDAVFNIMTADELVVDSDTLTPTWAKMVQADDVTGDTVAWAQADTFYRFNHIEAGYGKRITYSSNRVTIVHPGDYEIIVFATVSCSGNNSDVYIAVGKNGVLGEYSKQHSQLAQNEKKQLSMGNIPTGLAKDDYIEVFFSSDGEGDVVTVYHLNFMIKKL